MTRFGGSGLLGSGARLIRADPARAQGVYYLVTGLWPIVHLRSFMAITGPKRDTWLVRTFGALVSAIGVSLLTGRADRDATARLAVSSAVALAACEAVFVARGRISPIYLADALIELGLAGTLLKEHEMDRPDR